MKAIIYVFSGSGNTLKTANLYKEQFEKNQIETGIPQFTVSGTDVYPDQRGRIVFR